MHIYVPPFWLGVIATLIVEFALLLAAALLRKKK